MDDIVNAYDSSSDSSHDGESSITTSNVDFQTLKEKFNLNSTPQILIKESVNISRKIDSHAKEVSYNPKYEELFQPEVGPLNPFKTKQQAAPKNTLSGYVEDSHFNDFQFENQRRTFSTHGYALDPSVGNSNSSGNNIIGDIDMASQLDGRTVFESGKRFGIEKRKRGERGDPSDIDCYKGPWAGYVDENKIAKPTEEEQAVLDDWKTVTSKKKKEETVVDERSTLHIKDALDYQGRSFLHPPQDMGVRLNSEEPPEKCFLPKKHIHTWTGHTKGVSAIRLFPLSGHLLLSCSMDSKIKLWEVYGNRRCIRTYLGHDKAVRDICFNNDGTEFLSAAYDRYIKLWDTETGQCKGKFTNKRIPYCVKFNPEEDKQHLFIAGLADKKIVTWDMRANEIVQEYDRHLGAVNTVTFIDDNRRFVSTSDDKSLRVWEWDIPVDSKYIADPSMHSVPAVTLSPNQKWLACQSMDNQILIYNALSKMRMNRKKVFKGHMVAGYACQVNFSPDGSYVISGDADGKLFIWDWKSTKVYSKFKAHDQVCIGCCWLPHETSKVITCGWDGLIKLWD
ncbi:uncharacterized protein TRIADDRAFT_26041 [Trichoplax adhaerens]|uniref:Pre-mRNA-processing factor 17 n=1 Tax=Trichoplax adhaerens TaxID=10228 RepID=B3RYA4_TRIAD|nr:hypothetical protein TRIADDRAFT_26041 [Trichoplax adhaerens]EDV24566.1 hypothetical protein TRIADDRAFT_26041 [Trichoplax adhaerens]|eukprot:XP_002112456.1 hypothetical protein TRIADDRAFT_26041 [Trichoplax adhaerens]